MKRLLLTVFAAVATAPACTPSLACYSDGFRTGVIQKLSYKGIVSRSYEGELVMSGLKLNYATGSGNVWRFSARDKAIGQQLEQAAQTQKPVSLKYCQELFSVTTDTKYIITSVTFLNN